MSLVSNWTHVDLFTVDQAAALWSGLDPARVSASDLYKPSEVVAAKQMLTAAIVSGEVRVDTRTNYFARIGNHSESLVSRTDLEAFARRRGLFPAFLFDTLAPFESLGGFHSGEDVPRAKIVPEGLLAPINQVLFGTEGTKAVEQRPLPTINDVLMAATGKNLSAADSEVARVEANSESPKRTADAPSPPVNRGGRPAEYDWDTFVLEIIRRANRPDGLPETQGELVRDMLTWFQSTSGREPAESSVKARISKIYRYLSGAKNLEE